jgi:hypothetical protein
VYGVALAREELLEHQRPLPIVVDDEELCGHGLTGWSGTSTRKTARPEVDWQTVSEPP